MIRYSLHGRRVEPDTLVSIHGLAPGWSLQFWNPEKLLEGGYYCVHGSCSSATTSFLFYSIITGNAQFLVPFPYDKSSPVSQARKRRLFQQKNCPVNFCTSLVLVWVIDWCLESCRELVAHTHIWSHHLRYCMHVCRCTYHWGPGVQDC